jgi:hypothetical protein
MESLSFSGHSSISSLSAVLSIERRKVSEILDSHFLVSISISRNNCPHEISCSPVVTRSSQYNYERKW